MPNAVSGERACVGVQMGVLDRMAGGSMAMLMGMRMRVTD